MLINGQKAIRCWISTAVPADPVTSLPPAQSAAYRSSCRHHRLPEGKTAVIGGGYPVEQDRYIAKLFQRCGQKPGILKTATGQGDSFGGTAVQKRPCPHGKCPRTGDVKQIRDPSR